MERNTKQKEIIYEVLKDCHLHPSLPELTKLVWEKNPSIGQATVYRVMNKLVAKGEVEKIASIDHNIRYDIAKDHYHFQCVRCGKIEDIFYNKTEKEEIKNYLRVEMLILLILLGMGCVLLVQRIIIKRKKVYKWN